MSQNPPFGLEVSPTTVARGAPITVTVRFEQAGFKTEEITGLLGFARRPTVVGYEGSSADDQYPRIVGGDLLVRGAAPR